VGNISDLEIIIINWISLTNDIARQNVLNLCSNKVHYSLDG